MQSCVNFGHKLDPNYWQSQIDDSEKPSGAYAVKNLILLDPSKTKIPPYWTMRRTSLADGERRCNWDGVLPNFIISSVSHLKPLLKWLLTICVFSIHLNF